MKGYRILGRRVRTHAGEIDLVARSPRGVLCFIEVKARTGERAAVESVSLRQQQRIARAAALFVAGKPGLARSRHALRHCHRQPRCRATSATHGGHDRRSTRLSAQARRGRRRPARHCARGADARHPRSCAGFARSLPEHISPKSKTRCSPRHRSSSASAMAPARFPRCSPAASAMTATALNYDDPRNADLVSVIDRRRGLPVALGILYIHAARAAGMVAAGLNTQGHFVVRLAHRQDDVTIDPFNGGVVRRSRRICRRRTATAADVGLAQPVSDTDVLLRLQNNLKLRALDQGNTRARSGDRQPHGPDRAAQARTCGSTWRGSTRRWACWARRARDMKRAPISPAPAKRCTMKPPSRCRTSNAG